MAQKKITRKELSEKLEISAYGLDLMIKRETMDIRTLEKMSEILNVPVCSWFNEDKEEYQKYLISEDAEKYVLVNQLKVKDHQIDFLQNYIIKNQQLNEKK